MHEIIQNVATNIISGFLGVGKTTAILTLFTNKPASEKWAVLVNEFGKIGIDGHIYQANGITVKEIPGGCICCAQGLPLLVAVNRLLRETKPDRLIIESSGIGHPGGVLKTLNGDNFNNVLTLKAGICLVDPRHLLQSTYQNNALFKEQLQIADILVANKIDLANADAIQAFNNLATSFSLAKELITTTKNGLLKAEWLDLPHLSRFEQQTYSIQPQSQHWQTHSFSFSKNTLFDLTALKHWVSKSQIMRLKGFVQTKDGCYLLNYTNDKIDVSRYDKLEDNYIEVINDTLNISKMETAIKLCIASQSEPLKF